MPTPSFPLILTNYSTAEKMANAYRVLGKTICLTQGSFDMIHIGHGRYLEKAKAQADVLIVGVDSDEKVRSRKGPDRPVVPQDERLEMLTHLKSVDHVVLKDITAPKWDLIKRIKPDVLVTTASTYTPEQIKELGQWCKQVQVFESQATTSTSAKLRRMQIAFAHNFSSLLAQRIQKALDEMLNQYK